MSQKKKNNLCDTWTVVRIESFTRSSHTPDQTAQVHYSVCGYSSVRPCFCNLVDVLRSRSDSLAPRPTPNLEDLVLNFCLAFFLKPS